MAQRQKPTTTKPITFSANGRDYVISMSVNAMCQLEAKIDPVGFPVFLSSFTKAEDISLRNVRLLFWAGLIDHQPETSIEQAGELILAAGGLKGSLEMAMQALINSRATGFLEAPAA